MIPKFRIVQFGEPNPDTGNRFYIEWYIRKTIYGIPVWKHWVVFIDPAIRTGGGDWGYKTLPEARSVIERYKVNMQPQYHYVE